MKIVHVSPMYAPALGGAEHHLKAISERLVSRGHDVTVLTADVSFHEDLWPGRSGQLPRREILNGVKVVRFSPSGGLVNSGLDLWKRLRGGYRSLRLVFGEDGMEFLTRKPFLSPLIPYLLRSRADIVTSANWYWPPAYHVYLVRKLKRFTLVGIPLFHTAEFWCGNSVYGRMLAVCDAVVVNTSHEGEFVRERSKARVEVAGVGIEPESFKDRDGAGIRRRYLLGDSPVVGFVGRQAANKGATRLIEAMEFVWQWNNKVKLVLAGPSAHRSGDVDRVIANLSEANRAKIINIGEFADSEKPSIFEAFDIFALPSTSESFGIAYLEAWLCNKPVVGANIGPTRCVIDDGVDGLLANPNEAGEIARAIIALLSDPCRRQTMGRNGCAKTMSRYTWDKVTDKVEQLYLSLSNNQQCRVLARAEPQ